MRSTLAFFLSILFSLSLLEQFSFASPITSDDLKRNKALATSLHERSFERHRIVKSLPHGEEETHLLISLPAGEALKPFPVLYVLLDGAPKFLSGIEFAHNNGDRNTIFVGIPSSNRIRDFTSPFLGEVKTPLDDFTQSLLKASRFEGDKFSAHLAQNIMPYLQKEYGPFSVTILVGGSLGGISVLDTLASYPDSFDAYAALSPSLWHNFAYYENKFVALGKTSALLKNKCLLLSASEDEPTIFEGTRKLDKLLQGLNLPQSFRYQYKRLQELQHIQAIQLGYLLVPPFVFNAADILLKQDFGNLSYQQFQEKLRVALKAKTCISHPTAELTYVAYNYYGKALVSEKRFDDAFSLYEKMKGENPNRTLTFLGTDSFIFSAFNSLTKHQKDTMATDYINAYAESLKRAPESIIHRVNFELLKYIDDNKIGPLPHQRGISHTSQITRSP